jgi:hypothetical protein
MGWELIRKLSRKTNAASYSGLQSANASVQISVNNRLFSSVPWGAWWDSILQ